MIVKKFSAKTEAKARELAIKELGDKTVIMNVKTMKSTGILKWFKSPTVEVTAAIEDEKDTYIPSPAAATMRRSVSATPTLSKILEDDDKMREDSNLGERIDNLQHFLEQQFKAEEKKKEMQRDAADTANSSASGLRTGDDTSSEALQVLHMISEKLLENEVDEAYVAQIMEEASKSIPANADLNTLLSNVYQRIILKFGQAHGIELTGRRPKVVFFVGPTGVGKTTTIAKIASRFKVEEGRSVALLTADTYRIAAADQLRIYADILNVPLSIIYSAEELGNAILEFMDYELILVDTAGFSHRNLPQKKDMQKLLDAIDGTYEKEVYLVLSATTKYKDLIEIVDAYGEMSDFKLIYTKLDETSLYGNLLNIRLRTGAGMSYITNGQNVPDDIEMFHAQRLVKQLLGGK